MSIKINARSRSSDPAQENLRERKQVWNEACSAFIARLNALKPHLISFKRGLNGRGDPKAGIPISNIKDPLPKEINIILNNINSDFNDLASTFTNLVSDANGIIQEQAQYSKNRRKSTSKNNILNINRQRNFPTSATLETSDKIVITASNPLSRFWANLSAMFSSDHLKDKRLSLLSMSHKMFKNLIDFEDVVLSKDEGKIPEILQMYFLVSNNLSVLKLSFKDLLTKLNGNKPVNQELNTSQKSNNATPDNPDINPDRSIGIKPNIQIIEQGNFYPVNDKTTSQQFQANVAFMLNLDIGFTINDVSYFFKLTNKRKKQTDLHQQELLDDVIREEYKKIFNKFKEIVAHNLKVHIGPEASLKDIVDIIKNADHQYDTIDKYGSNYITRLLKKYRHQVGPKSPSSAAKLELNDLINQAKKYVDEMMDLFESKNIEINEVLKIILELEKILEHMKLPIKILNTLYKDKYYHRDNKIKNPKLDPAGRYFVRQIRRDVDKPDW